MRKVGTSHYHDSRMKEASSSENKQWLVKQKTDNKFYSTYAIYFNYSLQKGLPAVLFQLNGHAIVLQIRIFVIY